MDRHYASNCQKMNFLLNHSSFLSLCLKRLWFRICIQGCIRQNQYVNPNLLLHGLRYSSKLYLMDHYQQSYSIMASSRENMWKANLEELQFQNRILIFLKIINSRYSEYPYIPKRILMLHLQWLQYFQNPIHLGNYHRPNLNTKNQ